MKIADMPWQVTLPVNGNNISCASIPNGYMAKTAENYLQNCGPSPTTQYISFHAALSVFIPKNNETIASHLGYFSYINTHIVTNIKEQSYITGQQYDSASQQWKNIYSQTNVYTVKRPTEAYEAACQHALMGNPFGYRVVGERFVTGCVTNTVSLAPNALLLKKIQDEVEIICIKPNSTNNLYFGQTIPDGYTNATYTHKEDCPIAYSGSNINARQMIRK